MRRVKKKSISMIVVFCLLLVVNTASPRIARASTMQEYAEQAMKCYMGVCGHRDIYLEYANPYSTYSVTGKGTEYQTLGRYVDPGQDLQVSETAVYTSTISGGLEIGISICKLSLGITESLEKQYSYTYTLYNRENYRKYAHIGIEYSQRVSTGIKLEKRVLNPYGDSASFGSCCKYEEKMLYPATRVPKSMGFNLLAYEFSTPNISY